MKTKEQLKTLKDLEEQDSLRNAAYMGLIDEPFMYVEPSLLRNEAIKWIKKFEEQQKQSNEIVCNEKYSKSERMTASTSLLIETSRISWIKTFFNISDEELK